MSNLTTFLKNIKKKAAVGLMGATLIAAPGGVVLAHGNHDNNRDDQRSSHNNRWDNDNDNRRSAWQKNCDERQARANQKITEFKEKQQQRFNGLSLYLGNQQTFVTDNNLTIENYDKLNEKATNAQNKTTEALEGIESPDINCSRPGWHDKKQIEQAKRELREAIKKFESKVQKLSSAIADDVVIS